MLCSHCVNAQIAVMNKLRADPFEMNWGFAIVLQEILSESQYDYKLPSECFGSDWGVPRIQVRLVFSQACQHGFRLTSVGCTLESAITFLCVLQVYLQVSVSVSFKYTCKYLCKEILKLNEEKSLRWEKVGSEVSRWLTGCTFTHWICIQENDACLKLCSFLCLSFRICPLKEYSKILTKSQTASRTAVSS